MANLYAFFRGVVSVADRGPECSPELFQDRRCARSTFPFRWGECGGIGWKPYDLIHQTALDPFGKEFGAWVRLKTLDRERHLLQHLVEKRQRGVG
jgi:hypothetical protein